MFGDVIKQHVPLLNGQTVWIMVEVNDARPSRYDSELKCTVINFLIMEQFTSREYLDMVLLYGEFRENSRAATRLYAERFQKKKSSISSHDYSCRAANSRHGERNA